MNELHAKREFLCGRRNKYRLRYSISADNRYPPKEKDMAYLEITLKVSNANRPAAAGIYNQYKAPFLKQIKGAQSKELLIRDEDVQVLHGFASLADANDYLKSALFTDDVVKGLSPYLNANPEVRIYEVA